MTVTLDNLKQKYMYLDLNHEGIELKIQVKFDDEGVVIDVFEEDEVIATTWKLHQEIKDEGAIGSDEWFETPKGKQLQDDIYGIDEDL